MPASLDRPIPERVARRAFEAWELSPSGCRISTYSVASHGYAQIGWKDDRTGQNSGTTAHRAAWTYKNGQISGGMTVDHTCKNRRCVNVDHLRLLTNYENARRTFGRDWPEGRCANGHPNSELIIADGGRRTRCRLCRAQYQRTYRARKSLTK